MIATEFLLPSELLIKETISCVHMCSFSYLGTWEMAENRLPSVGGRREDGGLSHKGQMKLFWKPWGFFKAVL